MFADFDDLYLRFAYVIGKDWEICAGLDEGTTQIAYKGVDFNPKLVFNFPLECTFKSTSPFGWPQLVLSGYGMDAFGNDVVRGYGTTHIPITPGRHKLRVPLFVPRSSSRFQQFLAWILGRRPEFVDPKVVAHNAGREMTRVRSQGYVNLTFNIVTKDLQSLGFRTESSEGIHPAAHDQQKSYHQLPLGALPENVSQYEDVDRM
ncbi:unnamed protein product [Didymodactylos carnosus]|uniref:B9 domain-containing protein 1 n=1 Tax=Didymodactylos carnosus TaxID=1234261 RepID=A0A813TVX7_9BILA|nr:unnamed protein product [Didymodactylos carnosus]CAF0945650.1 unnamed protein product [Didymodactylos carnosus]CAF3606518.1 unnamed protein product [Didymodactylos carnosus]CAF3720347.1 unnamed protein product [Didymodactylos carnosus]